MADDYDVAEAPEAEYTGTEEMAKAEQAASFISAATAQVPSNEDAEVRQAIDNNKKLSLQAMQPSDSATTDLPKNTFTSAFKLDNLVPVTPLETDAAPSNNNYNTIQKTSESSAETAPQLSSLTALISSELSQAFAPLSNLLLNPSESPKTDAEFSKQMLETEKKIPGWNPAIQEKLKAPSVDTRPKEAGALEQAFMGYQKSVGDQFINWGGDKLLNLAAKATGGKEQTADQYKANACNDFCSRGANKHGDAFKMGQGIGDIAAPLLAGIAVVETGGAMLPLIPEALGGAAIVSTAETVGGAVTAFFTSPPVLVAGGVLSALEFKKGVENKDARETTRGALGIGLTFAGAFATETAVKAAKTETAVAKTAVAELGATKAANGKSENTNLSKAAPVISEENAAITPSQEPFQYWLGKNLDKGPFKNGVRQTEELYGQAQQHMIDGEILYKSRNGKEFKVLDKPTKFEVGSLTLSPEIITIAATKDVAHARLGLSGKGFDTEAEALSAGLGRILTHQNTSNLPYNLKSEQALLVAKRPDGKFENFFTRGNYHTAIEIEIIKAGIKGGYIEPERINITKKLRSFAQSSNSNPKLDQLYEKGYTVETEVHTHPTQHILIGDEKPLNDMVEPVMSLPSIADFICNIRQKADFSDLGKLGNNAAYLNYNPKQYVARTEAGGNMVLTQYSADLTPHPDLPSLTLATIRTTQYKIVRDK